jgi:2-polyprenyl-3-methyl-5-hydroxy-6-metoxy-1,4-benzoquinol methylase
MKQLTAPDLTKFMDYSYIVLKNDGSAASAAIEFVKPKSRVLDVGAGSGAITKHFVKSNGCEVTAVELNPLSVKKLEKFCKKVFSLDINAADWSDALKGEGKFDHVVATDVLEHLYDPWTVLKNMASLLNENGSVILSLPHAGHSTVVMNFIDGNIDYREWGLLDKTHIRFFGLHNIEALYESAGLAIVRAHFVIIEPSQSEFSDRWKKLPTHIREMLEKRPEAHVYQVVTEAVPIARAKEKINLKNLLTGGVFKPKRKFLGLF